MNGRCKSKIERLIQELEKQEVCEKSALYGRLIFVVCCYNRGISLFLDF